MQQTSWTLWTSPATLTVHTTEYRVIDKALAAVHGVTSQVDQAINTFDPKSELSRINASGPGTYTVSGTLAQILGQALEAHRVTAGAFDPRVPAYTGQEPGISSYSLAISSTGEVHVVGAVPLERDVLIESNQLTLTRDISLNLISLGKAYAADEGVRLAAETTKAPAMLNLGGDIATAGKDSGWAITVQDLDDDPASTVELINQAAIATSSTQKRRWSTGGHAWHHIIDSATGLSAEPYLKTATVIAGSAVHANSLTTAAIVWGSKAHNNLANHQFPTRCVTHSNQVLTHNWTLSN